MSGCPSFPCRASYDPRMTQRSVRSWLLLAAAAVVAQQALTIYPESQGGARVFWGAMSLVLLWFVYRRHNVARILFAAIAVIGSVLFALADLTSMGTLLAVLYGIQALTMLVRPVRAWTCTEPAGQAVSPAK